MKANARKLAADSAIVFGLMALVVSGATCGKATRPVEPYRPAVPIPAQQTAAIVAGLDQRVPTWMASFHVPGVSIVGIEERRIAWERHYGVRRAGHPAKVDRDTVFEACSLSKPVFAYVVLKLVERGRLDLDEPLVNYLQKPYLPDQPLHKRITARMVLSHTSGFPNWRKGGWQSGGPLPVLFEPGTRFGYSGEGFRYLQRVVEQITGVPIERYVGKELFEPVGMTTSSYVWQDRYEQLAAAGHDRTGEPRENRPLFRQANTAGTLYCTAYEYARFLVEIMKPDRSSEHSLSTRSIEAMLTRNSKASGRTPVKRSGKSVPATVHWGLGWAIDKTASGDRIYHTGSNSGFRCYCEFDLKRGTGRVIMTNADTGARLWHRIMMGFGAP